MVVAAVSRAPERLAAAGPSPAIRGRLIDLYDTVLAVDFVRVYTEPS